MILTSYQDINTEHQIVIKSPILCNFDKRINDKIHNYIDEPCLCFSETMQLQFRNELTQLLIQKQNKLPIYINNIFKYRYTILEKLVFDKRKNMK
tara:strand:- start:2199 stop:2483 length:285 start_codon:yes stop_codon:yes gene_type:complete